MLTKITDDLYIDWETVRYVELFKGVTLEDPEEALIYFTSKTDQKIIIMGKEKIEALKHALKIMNCIGKIEG